MKQKAVVRIALRLHQVRCAAPVLAFKPAGTLLAKERAQHRVAANQTDNKARRHKGQYGAGPVDPALLARQHVTCG
jgi:hypothetical protein